MQPTIEPKAIFLGFCERANSVTLGNTHLQKTNIVGLVQIVLSYIFPYRLDGWSMILAISKSQLGNPFVLQITNDSEKVIWNVNMDFKEGQEGSELQFQKGSVAISPLLPTEGWMPFIIQLKGLGLVIDNPGNYTVQLLSQEFSQNIGSFAVTPVDPPPLTTERINAIKSDPNAMKSLFSTILCKKCSSQIRSYAALEKTPKIEEEGWVWYEDLPATFSCQCGQTTADLGYIRRNLYGFLGQPKVGESALNFTPMYEKSSLRETRSKFERLLRTNPSEESLQLFINENPILLHQFPANNIFSKPPILTEYKTDFGILSPQKELILIEIEKTTTRLMTKAGDPAADLTHALQQVRNWLHSFDTHKLAALAGMSIDPDQVSLIRGVVIAGREYGYDAKHLRILKATDWGRIILLTYDDLLFALDALIEKFEQL